MFTASFYCIISVFVHCMNYAYKYDETSALKIGTSTTQQGHKNHNKTNDKEPPATTFTSCSERPHILLH